MLALLQAGCSVELTQLDGGKMPRALTQYTQEREHFTKPASGFQTEAGTEKEMSRVLFSTNSDLALFEVTESGIK